MLLKIFCSTLLAVGLTACLVLPAARGQQSTSNAQPAGNAENGKRSFSFYGCSACHGYSGHGGVGPRLATTLLSMEALTKYVRQPRGVMPRYSTESQITDATLADIYAFLKSIPPPADAKTIPLLK
jgi:ubiquinol-cytochrome c reductase cytochrome c subunit